MIIVDEQKYKHAHQSVHALLRFEVSVCVISVNLDSDALDTRLVARKIVEHPAQEVNKELARVDGKLDRYNRLTRRAADCEALIMLLEIEHARPVLRFGAARACVQCDNGIVGVILALKQCLQSQRRRVVVQAL
mgnify:CR=1 FL=1